MKWQVTFVLLFFSTVAMIAGAQSSTEDQKLAQETQVRGHWTDPSTGLMWAGKDNGKAVIWHDAVGYCRNLRLAGYSDWRLATLDELASLVDKSIPTSERVGNTEIVHISLVRHVKGNLSLQEIPGAATKR